LFLLIGNKGFNRSEANAIWTEDNKFNHLSQGKTENIYLEREKVELSEELEGPKSTNWVDQS